MCEDCGCGEVERFGVQAMQPVPEKPARLLTKGDRPVAVTHTHWHTHADGTGHSHPHAHSGDEPSHRHDQAHHHDHDHDHDHGPDHHHHHHSHDHPHPADAGDGGVKVGAAGHSVVEVAQPVLARNQRLAERNRGFLRAKGVVALNLVSSPGAGKTTLLEKTLAALANSVPAAVIVGDLATARDAERLRASGAPVVQITTGTVCHLDAEMVARGMEQLDWTHRRLLLVENVGNLVCPADFDLGEDGRVVLLSVTEGEDKPLKYPPIFKSARAVVITKVDLEAASGADLGLLRRNVHAVVPGVPVFEVSARTGAGMDAWLEWVGEFAADA